MEGVLYFQSFGVFIANYLNNPCDIFIAYKGNESMNSIRHWVLSLGVMAWVGLVGEEPSELVDIQTFVPTIQVELKYATPDNFTGQIVYDFDHCFLVKEAALLLREAQEELEAVGLGLKVWDGYRPMAAQWKFWELVPDERYVSDPRKGGRHTRGTAVDLTLVGPDGEELMMPSLFDDFSEQAHRNYMGGTDEAISNRELLQEVMERHGFSGLPTEWWHFDLIGWENFPPMDLVLQ